MTKGFVAVFNVLLLLLMAACGSDSGGSAGGESKKVGNPDVVVHELSDPDQLNPITSTSTSATYMKSHIFQQLLAIDNETLELYGLLATDRPVITAIEEGDYEGGMSLTYEIRPEATWDNGTPITAEDYIFSIKCVKHPSVNAGSLRPYMEFIHDIVVDPTNNKKFTVYSKERYILAEAFSGYYVFPPYIYDPNGILAKYDIKDMCDPKKMEAMKNNEDLQQFAQEFNSPKYSREKGFVVGSGPYSFEEWETGQFIRVKRKENWWGDKAKDKHLQGQPSEIKFRIVNDLSTAVTALKGEDIDVMRSIPPDDFIKLQGNERFNKLYNLHSPKFLSYDYLGLNAKSPKLSDKRVRRAIAHLVNRDEIIEVMMQGLAQKVNGPINPEASYYNSNLPNIEFDVTKARNLLAEAGWEDSNGNGIVDKEIDGALVEMELEYKYNQGNERRKNVGIMLKENAKRAGIDINIVTREWTVFLEDTKKRDFDIFSGGWVQSPIPDDLKQIWHTESDNPDGDNRVGFGTAESDRLIDEIRVTLDEEKRREMYLRVQEIIFEEQPYVFLHAPKERISIHKRFTNTQISVNRPGYDVNSFTLVPMENTATPQ